MDSERGENGFHRLHMVSPWEFLAANTPHLAIIDISDEVVHCDLATFGNYHVALLP